MQHKKLGKRIALQVSEQLKTEDLKNLGNIRKMSNLGGDVDQWQVFLPDI